ncbi:DUF6314 family protein [Myceligenerans pegani]|uniref:DUF6314 domain-containing protein n=1 Tax=Myceligenerans pegani TaxID=2776917 RepID=A0ABR9N0X9_9MICO|nr:DUF6314 family protein [Myceligenerans sp. TRM 65318]MBE1876728.1 hypothetical protein [Myceligenerans sp. TRM 65318]MBE3018999.1 hypothetical protein [Myceligenerans sp. TRM 65318]
MDPSQLLGTWEFRREVRDRLDGTEYVASGEATFTPDGDGRICWAEEGTLRWADRSTPVSRTLFLVREPSGAVPGTDELASDEPRSDQPGSDDAAGAPASRWRVTFEDGRDFHPWTARPVEHVCGRDRYEGTIRFLTDHEVPSAPSPQAERTSWSARNRVVVRWDVRGPAKDYSMVTHYTRTASGTDRAVPVGGSAASDQNDVAGSGRHGLAEVVRPR